MAYTNSPQTNTYKTVGVAFSTFASYREGDNAVPRDSHIINMYYDFKNGKEGEPLRLKKRPGLASTSYSLSKVSPSDPIRGYFNDTARNLFYWVVLNKIYMVAPDAGTTVRTVATLNTTTGYVGTCAYLKSDNTRFVVFADGTDVWLDNAATTTCVRVTDTDLPSPHRPYPVYVDGYLFLIESDTGDIYNSAVDDPLSWVPGDFITAEMSSDYGVALARAKNYIIVFGQESIEYFYDAGIATGSPLQRNASAYQSIGFIGGLCQIGDVILFVGAQHNQGASVFAIKDFTVTKVSNDVVDRTIQPYVTTPNTKTTVVTDAKAHSVTVDGHNFYALNTTSTTWFYDVDNRVWYEWESPAGNKFNIEACWQMYNGATYIGYNGSTVITLLATDMFRDVSSNFTCTVQTPRLDFGTNNQKFAHRLFVDCSQYDNTGTSNLGISWSDKDWSDAGSTPRNINVYSVAPFFNSLGKFRSRSFRFTYTDNAPFWIKQFSLDLNIGPH